MESLGAEALIRGGIAADAAVVGEPTGNRPCLGHKRPRVAGGRLRRPRRTRRHAGTGLNAIVAAARFVELAGARLAAPFATRHHPLLGPPTLNFGTIRGGDQPSTVAARCALTLDRRSVPGESYDPVVAELDGPARRGRGGDAGLAHRGAPRRRGAWRRWSTWRCATAAEHPLARAAFAARRFVLGGDEPSFGPSRPGPTAPCWRISATCPTIVLGPGDLADAHSPREAIAVAELVAAARIYAALALELALGSEEETP